VPPRRGIPNDGNTDYVNAFLQAVQPFWKPSMHTRMLDVLFSLLSSLFSVSSTGLAGETFEKQLLHFYSDPTQAVASFLNILQASLAEGDAAFVLRQQRDAAV
jgi:hypothetical protein